MWLPLVSRVPDREPGHLASSAQTNSRMPRRSGRRIGAPRRQSGGRGAPVEVHVQTMNELQHALVRPPGDGSVSVSRTLDLLSLSLIPGLGDEGIGRVLAECRRQGPELRELYRTPIPRLREQFQLRGEAAACVANNAPHLRQEASALLERTLELGIVVLAPGDPGYPGLVDEFHDRQPPLLYARGDLRLLRSRCVTLLHSTPPTANALDEHPLPRCPIVEVA